MGEEEKEREEGRKIAFAQEKRTDRAVSEQSL
jgi:hypothetical protein